MFFWLSKLFWFAAAPTNLLTLMAAAGALLLFTRFRARRAASSRSRRSACWRRALAPFPSGCCGRWRTVSPS